MNRLLIMVNWQDEMRVKKTPQPVAQIGEFLFFM